MKGGVSRVVNDDEEAVETILQRLAEDVEGDCWAGGRGCRDYTVRNGFKSFSKLKLELGNTRRPALLVPWLFVLAG